MKQVILKTLILVIGIFAVILPKAALAKSKIYIDIEQAQVKKSLLALPPLKYYGSSASKKNLKIGQELFSVIANDLTVSNYFAFISPKAFLENTSSVGLKPAPGSPDGFDFNKWKTIGTEFLVRAGYKVLGSNVSLEIYLYYVPSAKLVFGKTYKGPKSALRKIAHTYSDDVLKNLTGKRGVFDTKIVVASNRGGLTQRAIFVSDWDGHNFKKITRERTVHISPAWSVDGKKVAYTGYAYHPKAKTRNADLFMYELATGKRWLLSYRKGINSGADFTPDGKHLLVTLSQGGNPDIFRITTNGKDLHRLTRGPNHAMNVEPAISPDGKKIAFSSDRSGKPMIYIMSSGGGNIKRITFAGHYNATPTWSPDGKKLVFTGFDKGHFDLFIVKPDGTSMERLTSAKKKNGKWANNESPRFSPDGRFIMFSSDRSGRDQLYIIAPDGKNERRITYDNYDYVKPKWSPYLE